MSAQEFAGSIAGFYAKSAVDQLLALAWYAEVRLGRSHFDGALLRRCFREAGAEPPDMSIYLPRLAKKKPPQIIKERAGYRLSAGTRRAFDARFGADVTSIAVAKSLTDLPMQIPDVGEREFLREALDCYKAKAFRATVIMVWILAFDHLTRWIVGDAGRLTALNNGIQTKYPKKGLVVSKLEDLESIKEYELIESARSAKLLDKNATQILKEKLSRRNMAAHPSQVTISQHSADEMITDLVTNIILRLK